MVFLFYLDNLYGISFLSRKFVQHFCFVWRICTLFLFYLEDMYGISVFI